MGNDIFGTYGLQLNYDEQSLSLEGSGLISWVYRGHGSNKE
jgi:hypothetical protein